MVAQKVDPERLAFVDEMGTNTSLSPLYAYSPKGARSYAQVPRNRGKNTTLLASMSLKGMGPCLAVEGTTSATIFERELRRAGARSDSEGWPDHRGGQPKRPRRRAGQGAHRRARLRASILATFLARFQSYRGSLLEDRRIVAQDGGTKPRSPC
jgi:DDE superfamily endonuclease